MPLVPEPIFDDYLRKTFAQMDYDGHGFADASSCPS